MERESLGTAPAERRVVRSRGRVAERAGIALVYAIGIFMMLLQLRSIL